MRITPNSDWTTYSEANNKILQWKIYCRKVTTLTESLTSGPTSFTEVTSYINEIPQISQKIELEAGQFTSDSFTVTANNLTYWLANWFDLSSSQQLEFKVICNLSLTGSSFTTLDPILASGFLDKMSIELNEAEDSAVFTVQSYDEYANRITGKNLTLQKTRTIGSDTCLVCNRIPGVYIYTAAPYLSLQTLNFIWNDADSIYQIKYNGGEDTTVQSSTTDIVNIRDENNKLCQIYVIPSELEKAAYEQKFIFKNTSDSLPYVFYDDETIANMLTNICNEMPVVSSTITNPTFSPYDSGYRLSNLENISNDIGNARAKCIEWDSTNSLLWVGVGNKLYNRTTGGTWTLKGTFNNGTIKKIWVDRVANGHIWVLLRKDVDEDFYFGKCVISSGVTSEIDSGRLCSTGDIQNDYSNFYLDTTTNNIYYILILGGTQTIKYLDFDDDAVYSLDTITGVTVEKNAFSFYNSTYEYNCVVSSGGSYYIYNKDTNTTHATALPSIIYQAVVTSANTFYFTSTSGYIYKYTLTSGGASGTLTTISTTITAYGLYKSGSNIYFYGNSVESGSTYYPFAYINTSTDAITTLSNNNYSVDDTATLRTNQLVYVSGVIYLITPGGRFYQFTTSNTNRINGTYDTSAISIRDCLNEFCRIYNLIYICKPNKTLVVFPRSNSAGTIQTNGSASNLEVSASNINNLTSKLGAFTKANKVKVQSNGFTGEYNGTDYDVFDADDSKIVEISSDLIQHSNGFTLRDMAKHFYPFYSRDLQVINAKVETPKFEFEVTDGVTVELTSTKINQGTITIEDGSELLSEASTDLSAENTTGILQAQSINPDGSMEVEILI